MQFDQPKYFPDFVLISSLNGYFSWMNINAIELNFRWNCTSFILLNVSTSVLPFCRRCIWSKSSGLKLGPWIRWRSAGWACIPWVCSPRPWISSRQWSCNKTVYSWYRSDLKGRQTDRLAYLGNNQSSNVFFISMMAGSNISLGSENHIPPSPPGQLQDKTGRNR